MRPTTSDASVRWLVSVSLLLVLGAACSKSDKTPPVAAVSFSASKTRVALGSPIDLSYKFDVAPTAAISGNYRVFVHLVDADGTMLPWNDDHDPLIPTSQWKPGQTIQYTRTRFLPAGSSIGEATVQVGLYRGAERLALSGSDPADRTSTNRSYKVGTLQLLPSSENVFIIYKGGWHPPEFAPENPTLEWQWTQKSAVLTLRNPRRDVMLYLEYDARTDAFGGHPQQVTVYSGNQVVEKFAADMSAQVLRRIPVSAAQLGANEMAELRIEVDRTFVPATLPSGGRDSRELGLRVYHVFVEPR